MCGVRARSNPRWPSLLYQLHTSLTYIHFLRQKNEASCKDFDAWCQAQDSARVKTLRSNHGGEHLGREFIMHLKSMEFTVHDTPQHNCVSGQVVPCSSGRMP